MNDEVNIGFCLWRELVIFFNFFIKLLLFFLNNGRFFFKSLGYWFNNFFNILFVFFVWNNL